MPATCLALLRGINVGGKNKLPMQDLTEMFVAAGCADVRTFIQSGNVIFRADPSMATELPGVITARIAARFGFRAPLLVRTAEQLGDIVANNPFLPAGAAEETLHVMFLADQPSPTVVASLDPDRSPPDAFSVRGREIYLRLPGGMARTRLTNAYFDARLGTTSTARNWRTVTALEKLMNR